MSECGACRFWRRLGLELVPGPYWDTGNPITAPSFRGNCTRFPPSPPGLFRRSGFPVTTSRDGCGEFKAAEPLRTCSGTAGSGSQPVEAESSSAIMGSQRTDG